MFFFIFLRIFCFYFVFYFMMFVILYKCLFFSVCWSCVLSLQNVCEVKFMQYSFLIKVFSPFLRTNLLALRVFRNTGSVSVTKETCERLVGGKRRRDIEWVCECLLFCVRNIEDWIKMQKDVRLFSLIIWIQRTNFTRSPLVEADTMLLVYSNWRERVIVVVHWVYY